MIVAGIDIGAATAKMVILRDGEVLGHAVIPTGHSIALAIDKVTRIPVGLVDYSLKAVTRGKDALGEVTVKIEDRKGRIISARGVSTDIIEASALAYVNAFNRLVSKKR